MTITTKQACTLRTLITKLVNAEREDSWKGSEMPEEWPRIEENLRIARTRLHEHIEGLKLDDYKRKP